MKAITGVLLVNLGTPDSPSVKDVRKYLFEFLNDPRVIDIPAIARFLLVNFIIVPFRAPKSAKIYKDLWTKEGSPILLYGESLQTKLQEALGEQYNVELAMRYQNPGLDVVLARMEKYNYKKIIIIPLFPQYASASTGSAIDKAMKLISKWWVIPEIKIISQFYDDEGFINTIVEQAKKYNFDEYDHILFSYHGLPERQIRKSSVDGYCQLNDKCCSTYHTKNQFCYRAQCFLTSRKLAEDS